MDDLPDIFNTEKAIKSIDLTKRKPLLPSSSLDNFSRIKKKHSENIDVLWTCAQALWRDRCSDECYEALQLLIKAVLKIQKQPADQKENLFGVSYAASLALSRLKSDHYVNVLNLVCPMTDEDCVNARNLLFKRISIDNFKTSMLTGEELQVLFEECPVNDKTEPYLAFLGRFLVNPQVILNLANQLYTNEKFKLHAFRTYRDVLEMLKQNEQEKKNENEILYTQTQSITYILALELGDRTFLSNHQKALQESSYEDCQFMAYIAPIVLSPGYKLEPYLVNLWHQLKLLLLPIDDQQQVGGLLLVYENPKWRSRLDRLVKTLLPEDPGPSQ